MKKTTKRKLKPRPKYRVQLVKSATNGLWFHRIKGANGEIICASEIYDAKDSNASRGAARRTAKPLAAKLEAPLEVVDVSE